MIEHNMRYLQRFENISIFDDKWIKLLPQELTIVTENGEFTLKSKGLEPEMGYPGIYNLMNCVSIIYAQNTLSNKDDDVTADGEPDTLQIDITMVKDNDGFKSNPDSLRLNIDITYGDQMQYEFTIDKPNKVNVYHYTGKNSLYDPETFWGFKNESLQKLVEFFNRFGFETTIEDFKFIDEDPDSYHYDNPFGSNKKTKSNIDTEVKRLEPMIMDDDMKSKVDSLRGGDKIKKYNEFHKNEMIKFRIIKESFKEDVEINLAHLIDDGFVVNIDRTYSTLDDETSDNPNFDYMIRIWLPVDKSDTEYSYENSAAFNWSKIEDEVIRAIGYILEHNEIDYLYTIAAKGQDGYGFNRTKWSVDQLIDGNINPGVIKCLIISVTHPQLTSL